MKAAALFLLAFGTYLAAPDIPAVAPNAAYPVHVRILVTKSAYSNGDYSGHGRGDILGAEIHGFDYTFECNEPFMDNRQPGEFYQARWKKQDLSLELLMQKVGSKSIDKCELKTSVKPAPYGSYQAAAPTAP